MCMTGDDDFWDFYNEYSPRARIPHTCVECGRTIVKGETYRTQGGLSDGSFVWYKTCAHCDAASKWLAAVCEGWLFTRREEDFLEHVIGHEAAVRSRPLVRLVRWMRADWKDPAGSLRPLEAVTALTTEAIGAYRTQFIAATAAR